MGIEGSKHIVDFRKYVAISLFQTRLLIGGFKKIRILSRWSLFLKPYGKHNAKFGKYGKNRKIC